MAILQYAYRKFGVYYHPDQTTHGYHCVALDSHTFVLKDETIENHRKGLLPTTIP